MLCGCAIEEDVATSTDQGMSKKHGSEYQTSLIAPMNGVLRNKITYLSRRKRKRKRKLFRCDRSAEFRTSSAHFSSVRSEIRVSERRGRGGGPGEFGGASGAGHQPDRLRRVLRDTKTVLLAVAKQVPSTTGSTPGLSKTARDSSSCMKHDLQLSSAALLLPVLKSLYPGLRVSSLVYPLIRSEF